MWPVCRGGAPARPAAPPRRPGVCVRPKRRNRALPPKTVAMRNRVGRVGNNFPLSSCEQGRGKPRMLAQLYRVPCPCPGAWSAAFRRSNNIGGLGKWLRSSQWSFSINKMVVRYSKSRCPRKKPCGKHGFRILRFLGQALLRRLLLVEHSRDAAHRTLRARNAFATESALQQAGGHALHVRKEMRVGSRPRDRHRNSHSANGGV